MLITVNPVLMTVRNSANVVTVIPFCRPRDPGFYWEQLPGNLNAFIQTSRCHDAQNGDFGGNLYIAWNSGAINGL